MPADQTQVLVVDAQDPDSRAIQRAAQMILDGGLVVLPTDTVYGLVCDPRRPAAIDQIYRVKGRPRDQPLILLLHDMAQASACLKTVPDLGARAMQHFWPGPLTVVLKDRSPARAALRAGGNTIGLRLPAHVVPRLVAAAVGSPLASTSANRSGRPAPTSAQQVLKQVRGYVPLLLDSGPTPLGQESSVVDFTTDPPRLLRPGAISVHRLREVLGEVREKL